MPIMGFKGSPPYTQRQIDRMLRPFRKFARAYINDVIIFSKSVDEHLRHLREVFDLFQSIGLRLSPVKSYLGYPSVQLLGQRVDGLGLSTDDEKREAILKLEYPETLRDLEHYLGLTVWFPGYINKYAQRAEPLQARKTKLLKNAPAGKGRKSYTGRTRVEDPTTEEREASKDLQDKFARQLRLYHHNSERPLFIDVDASHDGIGSVAYHLKGDKLPASGKVTADLMEPILFLSRSCSPAERRYGSTELKVLGPV